MGERQEGHVEWLDTYAVRVDRQLGEFHSVKYPMRHYPAGLEYLSVLLTLHMDHPKRRHCSLLGEKENALAQRYSKML